MRSQLPDANLYEPAGWITESSFGLDRLFLHTAERLRRDIRFVALCHRAGLAASWVREGRWPDCTDQVRYDFRGEAQLSLRTRPHSEWRSFVKGGRESAEPHARALPIIGELSRGLIEAPVVRTAPFRNGASNCRLPDHHARVHTV